MPHKFNEGRRSKIPKAKYRVTNWPEYDAALVRQESLTVWVTEEALAAWLARATRRRGGQPVYSDPAIETGLALRSILHQPLRQTEGALGSIADLLDVEMRISDHTTLSRRGGGLTILPKRIERDEPLHLLVDSAGVKLYGEGEWLDQKHGMRSRRRWRELHLAVDADTHEIAAELTPDYVGDVSAFSNLLDQIEGFVASATAGDAYDAEVVYDAVTTRNQQAAIIVSPRSTAVSSETASTQRDKNIEIIAQHGRIAWQRSSGYCRRSRV